jgi:hypothetical protein
MVAQDDLQRYRADFEKLPEDQRDKTDDYMFKDNSPMDFGTLGLKMIYIEFRDLIS